MTRYLNSAPEDDPCPALQTRDRQYRERVFSLAKINPSRQLETLPEPTRRDVAAVREWMDCENERAGLRLRERAEREWAALGVSVPPRYGAASMTRTATSANGRRD